MGFLNSLFQRVSWSRAAPPGPTAASGGSNDEPPSRHIRKGTTTGVVVRPSGAGAGGERGGTGAKPGSELEEQRMGHLMLFHRRPPPKDRGPQGGRGRSPGTTSAGRGGRGRGGWGTSRGAREEKPVPASQPSSVPPDTATTPAPALGAGISSEPSTPAPIPLPLDESSSAARATTEAGEGGQPAPSSSEVPTTRECNKPASTEVSRSSTTTTTDGMRSSKGLSASGAARHGPAPPSSPQPPPPGPTSRGAERDDPLPDGESELLVEPFGNFKAAPEGVVVGMELRGGVDETRSPSLSTSDAREEQFFQAMCKRREEEEAARLRALEGLTAEERAARLQAEEDARAHEESQMAHFQRLNKKLRGGGRAAVAVRGGRGRGARGGASRGSLK